MLEMDLKTVAAACFGKINGEGKINGVCTDTRKIEKGCLFIALEGENFDGHDFARTAAENGAAAVMCHKKCDCGNAAVITVDDTKKGLLRLSQYYRKMFNIPVVGITGSVGKTTTKEMVYCVLASKYKTLKNYGNLNNQIGMPMAVFDLDNTYEAAVFEMGMANFGEISNLSLVAAPDVGVLTNIGVSHMETLGSQENILKAKLELLDGMKDGAPLIINGDDAFLKDAVISNHPKYYYGIESDKCTIFAENIRNTDKGTAFTAVFPDGEQQVQLPTVGIHHVYNALAAIQVGLLLNVSPEESAKALEGYEPTGMRQRLKNVKGITFIEDCYNASPDSMKAAVSALCSVPKKRKIAVLGDMLELGEISDKAHTFTGELVAKNNVDILMTYGTQGKLIAEGAKSKGMENVFSFDDKQKLSEKLKNTVRDGDAVLFKASRGMKLEDVINYIYENI